MVLYALNGFLGLKREWDFLSELSDDTTLVPLSLFETPLKEALFSPSFEELANAIQTYCQSTCPKDAIPILLGYSFGGRIALHCLEKNTGFWKGAILVSAHPGLLSEEEKEIRRKKDSDWKECIRTLPWHDFLHKWNSQAVFSNSSSLPKNDCFDKEALCHALEVFSLSNQKSFFHFLSHVKFPILWATGDLDEKFASIAKELKASSKVEVWIARECGHRLAWDDKDLFQKKTKEFIGKVRNDANND